MEPQGNTFFCCFLQFTIQKFKYKWHKFNKIATEVRFHKVVNNVTLRQVLVTSKAVFNLKLNHEKKI